MCVPDATVFHVTCRSTGDFAMQLFGLAQALERRGPDGKTVKDKILAWFVEHGGKHPLREFYPLIGAANAVCQAAARMDQEGAIVREKVKQRGREIYVYSLPKKGRK